MGMMTKLEELKQNRLFRFFVGGSAFGLGAAGTAFATTSRQDQNPPAPQRVANQDKTETIDLEGTTVLVPVGEPNLRDTLDDDSDGAVAAEQESPDSPDTPAVTEDSPESPDTPDSPAVADESPDTPDSPAVAEESPESPDSPDSPAEEDDSPDDSPED